MDEKVKILYVEDDETLAFLTRDNLQMNGFEVQHVTNAPEALQLFSASAFDICLLDVMLAAGDGFDLARQIRSYNQEVPIIFLTARSLQEDKIKGLTIGGDDYITKPFNIEELVLKIKIFLKRSQKKDIVTYWQFGSLKFQFEKYLLQCKGKDFRLTEKEARLFQLLISQCNQVVKRNEILQHIWGDDDYFMGRSMDVFISRLRKMIAEEPGVRIENVHGVGFIFTVQ